MIEQRFVGGPLDGTTAQSDYGAMYVAGAGWPGTYVLKKIEGAWLYEFELDAASANPVDPADVQE